MGHRLDIKRIIQSNFVRDLPMVVLGCAIAAFATDMFMIPNGLAAGGVTGVATIIQELGARNGLTLPVGIQTIVINAVLLLAVARAGGLLYVIQTVTGFVLLGVFTDLFAPFVTPLGGEELMLSALWGALACGLGYGLVLRCGSNTGGSDTIGQIISRKTRFRFPCSRSSMRFTLRSPWCSWVSWLMPWSTAATSAAWLLSFPIALTISRTTSCTAWDAAAPS